MGNPPTFHRPGLAPLQEDGFADPSEGNGIGHRGGMNGSKGGAPPMKTVMTLFCLFAILLTAGCGGAGATLEKPMHRDDEKPIYDERDIKP